MPVVEGYAHHAFSGIKKNGKTLELFKEMGGGALEHYYHPNSTVGSWGWVGRRGETVEESEYRTRGKVGSGGKSRHGKEAKCSLGPPRGVLYRVWW